VQTAGLRGLLAWALSGLARKIDRPSTALGVRDEDVLGADLSSPPERARHIVAAERSFIVNWVMSPPAETSGGHTTAFRLIRHLQARGHTCRVYFYDVAGGEFSYYESIVHRVYADPSTEVGNVFHGMKDADAVFATAWETAYPVYNATSAGKRFYLVQDFEPAFYPAGGTATLAENTYRMGFHGVTAGRWLAKLLDDRYGMRADAFEFGCDTDLYRFEGKPRDGIVFYARPQAARRGFDLGVMALELFTARHPDIKIHFFGSKIGNLHLDFVDHGRVIPAELNDIYNSCFAGLCLSMTNVSLVPHEMLAAGCIPVVNDADHNRMVLDNGYVRYATATPHALAACLSEVVTHPDFNVVAREASASVALTSWDDAGEVVEGVLRRELSQSTS
jgi:glycosyltransferase involved in cell wall biosynthesis